MIQISIIICTYNRDKYVYSVLQRIAENHYNTDEYEIVLINNNSTDHTELECTRFKHDYQNINFRYIEETRQGLSYARNRGISEAHGEILVFLDDDAFVEKNYLQNLTDFLNQHPDIAAFGGRIIPKFEDGKSPKWLCKWTSPWVSAMDMGDKPKLFKGSSYPIGANMGMKKSCIHNQVFNVTLGRSKKNLMGGEEKDFFYRLKKKNLQIYYIPNIEVHHVIPPYRTTKEYVKKIGMGIGMSERLRCKKIDMFLKRFILECIKWGATLLLCLFYLLKHKSIVGRYLLIFRWNVTKGLLKIGCET
jgi:glucosyl-dolichyl phosphate glucuronosyltransferase